MQTKERGGILYAPSVIQYCELSIQAVNGGIWRVNILHGKVVYYYYRKWKNTGIWEQILDSLVIQERERQGKNNPAALTADSQSVKKVAFIHLDTGIDGGKFINGRKRHILVDELGLP